MLDLDDDEMPQQQQQQQPMPSPVPSQSHQPQQQHASSPQKSTTSQPPRKKRGSTRGFASQKNEIIYNSEEHKQVFLDAVGAIRSAMPDDESKIELYANDFQMLKKICVENFKTRASNYKKLLNLIEHFRQNADFSELLDSYVHPTQKMLDARVKRLERFTKRRKSEQKPAEPIIEGETTRSAKSEMAAQVEQASKYF